MTTVTKKRFAFLEYAALEPRLLDLREYAIHLHEECYPLNDETWDDITFHRMVKPLLTRLVGFGREFRDGESHENRLLLASCHAYETCINEVLHAYEWGFHKSVWVEERNAEIADRTRSLVADYAKLNDLSPPESWHSPSEAKMVLGDLAADLLHLGIASGVSAKEIVIVAMRHYVEEAEDETTLPLYIDTVNPS